jgi:hypothetical protein
LQYAVALFKYLTRQPSSGRAEAIVIAELGGREESGLSLRNDQASTRIK